jgi:EAL domain-containing protein (putative c-di-GMP-specific phosphodiesterase class I)
MSSIKVRQHEGYLEVHFPSFTSVEERIKQLEGFFKLIRHGHQSKVLLVIDQQNPPKVLSDIHKIVVRTHAEDWKSRQIGIFLKVAVLIPSGTASKYEMHQRAINIKDLDISIFETHEAALSWLLGHYPLNQVEAHFQKIVRLKNGSTAGYEALARKIVDGKYQLPGDWLPELFAEESGSKRLAGHMLEKALDALGHIPEDLYVSVNFEPQDLRVGAYENIIKRYPIEQYASRLVIEVAERGRVPIHTQEAIDFVKSMHGRVALDDIGAGASRLLQLIDFQPEILKLDKVITDRIGEKHINRFIANFSAWTKESGALLVAEGIESEDQAANCISAGVTYGQGFLYGKAKPLL